MAGSVLPMFHQDLTGHTEHLPSGGDDYLAELLGGSGDDLLASLLDPNTSNLDQLGPPLENNYFAPSSSPTYCDGTAAHSHSHSPAPPLSSTVEAVIHASPHDPNDGYVSDSSGQARVQSPYAGSYGSSHSPVDLLGAFSSSPDSAMVTSSSGGGLDSAELSALLSSLGEGTLSALCGPENSSDVKINVEPEPQSRDAQLASDRLVSSDSPTQSYNSPTTSSTTLVLTEEEKSLLAAQGICLPTDMPLTKQEQKQLKSVRRKIKNKVSAQESRKRKKEYVEGLEKRVEHCTHMNQQLRERVESLESENKSLLQQMKRVQSIVARIYPNKMQAGTLLMALGLTFSLLVLPWAREPALSSLSYSSSTKVYSRTLLFTKADEFGNIIDSETGHIVSERGGVSPAPPYPWSLKTPAFLSALTSTHSTSHHTPPHSSTHDL